MYLSKVFLIHSIWDFTLNFSRSTFRRKWRFQMAKILIFSHSHLGEQTWAFNFYVFQIRQAMHFLLFLLKSFLYVLFLFMVEGQGFLLQKCFLNAHCFPPGWTLFNFQEATLFKMFSLIFVCFLLSLKLIPTWNPHSYYQSHLVLFIRFGWRNSLLLFTRVVFTFLSQKITSVSVRHETLWFHLFQICICVISSTMCVCCSRCW